MKKFRNITSVGTITLGASVAGKIAMVEEIRTPTEVKFICTIYEESNGNITKFLDKPKKEVDKKERKEERNEKEKRSKKEKEKKEEKKERIVCQSDSFFLDFEGEEESRTQLKQLYKIWTSTFKKEEIDISKNNTQVKNTHLLKVWQDVFKGDYSLWQEYARTIKANDFLMGRVQPKSGSNIPFKASFKWLIKISTIKAVLFGKYNERSEGGATDVKVTEREGRLAKIKANVSHEKEQAAFNKYIKGKEYLFDGDVYKVECMAKGLGNGWLESSGDSIRNVVYGVYLENKYKNLEIPVDTKREVS